MEVFNYREKVNLRPQIGGAHNVGGEFMRKRQHFTDDFLFKDIAKFM